jgi:hypothetical protein
MSGGVVTASAIRAHDDFTNAKGSDNAIIIYQAGTNGREETRSLITFGLESLPRVPETSCCASCLRVSMAWVTHVYNRLGAKDSWT